MKKSFRKLELNKMTITNLSSKELNSVNGGKKTRKCSNNCTDPVNCPSTNSVGVCDTGPSVVVVK